MPARSSRTQRVGRGVPEGRLWHQLCAESLALPWGWGSPQGPPLEETQRCKFDPGVRKIPLEKETATYTSMLGWENPMDRGAWRATIHGVTESDTPEPACHVTPTLDLDSPNDHPSLSCSDYSCIPNTHIFLIAHHNLIDYSWRNPDNSSIWWSEGDQLEEQNSFLVES